VAIKGGKVVAQYRGSRTVDDFARWVRLQISAHGGAPTTNTTTTTPQGPGYVKLNDSTFDSQTAGKLAIVDFYADWCGPCRAFAPTFETVSKKVSGVLFAKVDTDASRQLSSRFGIRSIPYIVAIKGGKVVAQYRGSRTVDDFANWVRQQIAAQGGSTATTTTARGATLAIGTKFSFSGGYFEKVAEGKWTYCINGACTEMTERVGLYSGSYALFGFFKPQNKSVWVSIPKNGGMSYWTDGQTWKPYLAVTKN